MINYSWIQSMIMLWSVLKVDVFNTFNVQTACGSMQFLVCSHFFPAPVTIFFGNSYTIPTNCSLSNNKPNVLVQFGMVSQMKLNEWTSQCSLCWSALRRYFTLKCVCVIEHKQRASNGHVSVIKRERMNWEIQKKHKSLAMNYMQFNLERKIDSGRKDETFSFDGNSFYHCDPTHIPFMESIQFCTYSHIPHTNIS